MKTLQWAAAALAVGALALPSGAETVTTNDWWDVRFESPTPTGVNLEIGELGALTNFDNQALGTVKPYLSGQWSMIDGDESYVTNEFNTVTTNGVTFGGDWCIKLDTQGNDLTWTPTNNPVADITTLVDADLYLVGSDSPPDASDFDGTSDVQTAIYLKNETDEATGETTNSVLCVYVRNSSGGNYWQELDGVELKDNAWAHVQVSVDHTGDLPEVKVFVNGTQMYARGGTSADNHWTAANGRTSGDAHKVSSVAFRGTGAVDNFTGKTLQTSYSEYDFTAEVYMNDSLVETGTGVNQTKVVHAQAGSDKAATFTGFKFHDFVAGSHATTFSLEKIELINLSDGTTATYTYTYDNTAHQITENTPSENIVFATDTYDDEDEETGDITKVTYQTGVFTILAPTVGATADAVIAKVYFENLSEPGTYNAQATTTIGGTTTTDSKKVRPSEFAEQGATKTITWEFPATKDGNVLSTIQLYNGATLEYADKTATVTVTTNAALQADTLFAAATYGVGSLAEGQDLRWTEDGGRYTFTPYTPPVAMVVSADGTTTNDTYTTLAAAVEAAQDGETVELIADVTVDARIVVTKSMTINLGGHVVSRTADPDGDNGSVFRMDGNVVVLVTNGVIDCSGVDDSSVAANGVFAIDVKNGASLTLADLEITVDSECGSCVYPWVGSTVTITSGTYKNLTTTPYRWKSTWIGMAVNQANKDKTGNVATPLISITGGSFAQVDPALGDDSWGEGEGSFVAEGYKSVYDDTTGLYNVVPDVNMVEITFMNGATTLYTTQIVENAAVAYVGETPVKEGTDQYSYTFAGWSTTDGGEALESLPDATANATYYAVFTESVNQYKVEWIVDGVRTTNEWAYGATPSYGADDPTKDPTDATNFTFKAWDPEVVAVTGFASYTATWTETARTYAITFQTNGVDYATVAAEWHATGYAPADPAAPEGKVFKGWALSTAPTTVLDTLPEVSGAATYVAVFEDDAVEVHVNPGDGLDTIENAPAPIEFTAAGLCKIAFKAPAAGKYVLMTSETVNGTYLAEGTPVEFAAGDLVVLTETTAGTTKFFKIGYEK